MYLLGLEPMANPSESMDGTNTSNAGNPLTSFGIRVAIRVRPFNKIELGEKDVEAPQPVVELESDGKTLTLLDPSANFRERATFSFDNCFTPFAPAIILEGTTRSAKLEDSSDDEEAAAERAQADVYKAMGRPIIDSAWQGYNSCIFAYGQTSSGKSYTMMGTKRDPGVIPRLCRDLFERIENESGDATTEGRKLIRVTLSFMEIYNERVKDLLKTRPKDAKKQYRSRFDTQFIDDEYQQLRVRQHPLQGPFVEGLTKVDVASWLECVKYIRLGNELRSSTATDMNESSSRSHAIFQLVVTQTEALGAKVRGKEVVNHKVSKINLVDLAGSERIARTNVTGKHITEANYINQSLSTLRKVIDALVARKRPGQTIVVPYRESLLTWILADNFGGNSKTAMIANISPHYSNFAESESTLRYATLAKGIVNRARVNEDPSAKLIRELQAQLRQLQAELGKGAHEGHVRDLEEQMEENKKAMEELLAREEGMRVLIQESREREQQLRVEKESLEKAQHQWRCEAERLQREKEELTAQLRRLAGEDVPLAKTSSHSNMKKSQRDFWMESEPVDDAASGNNLDDASSCPPHQTQLVRRRRSAAAPQKLLAPQETELPFLSDVSPKENDDQHSSTKNLDDQRTLNSVDESDPGKVVTPVAIQPKKRANRAPPPWSDDPEIRTATKESTPHEEPSGPALVNATESVPEVRHGRRAATEQGERERPVGSSSDAEQVRTAGAGRRRDVLPPSLSSSPAPGQVPPSLAHLIAPVKQPSGPDALDSFLSGAVAAPPQRERGKPWKMARKTPTQASTPML